MLSLPCRTLPPTPPCLLRGGGAKPHFKTVILQIHYKGSIVPLKSPFLRTSISHLPKNLLRTYTTIVTPSSKDDYKSRFQKLKDKFYIPDVRLEPLTLILFVPLFFVFLTLFVSKNLKTKRRALYENLLFANLRNIEEGRLWTILTSIFSVNGELGNLLCAFFFSAIAMSNVIRTLGPNMALTLFLTGHLSTLSSTLLLNWTQSKRMEICMEQLNNDVPTIDPALRINTVENERLKLMNRVQVERVDLTAKQRKAEENRLKDLPPLEIIQMSKEHYLRRPLLATGGYLAAGGFFALVNSLARLPSRIFMPYALLVMMLYAYERRHIEYDFPEIAIGVLPGFMTALSFWFLTRGRITIYKWDPLLNVPYINVTNVKNRVMASLDKRNVEKMKKRTERFKYKIKKD